MANTLFNGYISRWAVAEGLKPSATITASLRDATTLAAGLNRLASKKACVMMGKEYLFVSANSLS